MKCLKCGRENPDDAVNTVQRLESMADPGKILISSTTAKLVSGTFYMSPLPPLKLKGKKEKPSFTAIVGDVGIGKSRLLFEFQKYLDELIPDSLTPIKIIPIRCVRYGTFIYQPLRESDSPTTVMSKIEKGALPEDPLSKHYRTYFNK